MLLLQGTMDQQEHRNGADEWRSYWNRRHHKRDRRRLPEIWRATPTVWRHDDVHVDCSAPRSQRRRNIHVSDQRQGVTHPPV